MTDYKEWIMNRAEELALDKYDIEYEYLPSNLREVVFFMAQRQYQDMCAVKVDFLYDRMREGI